VPIPARRAGFARDPAAGAGDTGEDVSGAAARASDSSTVGEPVMMMAGIGAGC
jgi:hypothetical protein